ncbi:hypothetical protein FVE85_1814 [Porphyridium purpureum]|uniref:Uncharacterized protein n=1 Tax=Porphyridium purpureum TaxID=35688 RepID=A0A5J4YVW6_PORPP|nr:hypothetical protein FVE85_1814 [Porphyridium purpureum]|eukprot:POR6428..scf209_3
MMRLVREKQTAWVVSPSGAARNVSAHGCRARAAVSVLSEKAQRPLVTPKKRAPASVRMMGDVDEQGRVRIATPFGVVRRDPYTLPPMVSKAAEMRPSEFADQSRLQELQEKLTMRDSRPQLQALQELCFFPPDQSAPLFIKVVQSSNDELARSQAVFSCTLFFDSDGPEAQSAFDAIKQALLSDSSPTVRSAAASALAYATAPRFECAQLLMRQLFEDSDWLVKMCVAVALGAVGDENTGAQMLPFLTRADPRNCEQDSLLIQGIIGALGQLGYEPCVGELARWLNTNDRMIRLQVAEALNMFDTPQALALLEGLVQDADQQVAQQATYSLDALRKRRVDPGTSKE